MLEAEDMRDPFKCAAIPDISVDAVDGPGAEVGISMACPLIEECGARFELNTTVAAEEIEVQLSAIRSKLALEVPKVCLVYKTAKDAGALQEFTAPPGLT